MARKVKLYPIDKDYLRLIQKVNDEGHLFVPATMGAAGYKSLHRLVEAGKLEYVQRPLVGGYRVTTQ